MSILKNLKKSLVVFQKEDQERENISEWEKFYIYIYHLQWYISSVYS